MSGTDLGSFDAQTLAQLFKSREASPLEATRAALERIERFNPAINAYVHVDAEGAESAAKASARRWGQGKPLSPIDGIPVSLKDLTQVAGMPCREGSLTASEALSRLIHEADLKTKIADGILLRNQNVPARI